MPLMQPLTDQESAALDLLKRGLSNKQIAAELRTTEDVIKKRLGSAYRKMGATNTRELLAILLGTKVPLKI